MMEHRDAKEWSLSELFGDPRLILPTYRLLLHYLENRNVIKNNNAGAARLSSIRI